LFVFGLLRRKEEAERWEMRVFTRSAGVINFAPLRATKRKARGSEQIAIRPCFGGSSALILCAPALSRCICISATVVAPFQTCHSVASDAENGAVGSFER
jgi:hypothetical protein